MLTPPTDFGRTYTTNHNEASCSMSIHVNLKKPLGAGFDSKSRLEPSMAKSLICGIRGGNPNHHPAAWLMGQADHGCMKELPAFRIRSTRPSPIPSHPLRSASWQCHQSALTFDPFIFRECLFLFNSGASRRLRRSCRKLARRNRPPTPGLVIRGFLAR